MKKKEHKYYDIREDIEKYPDAWCYIIYSHRGPGKTYSTLKYANDSNTPFIFMKRTDLDVEVICVSEDSFDLSPFKPINRDTGSRVYPTLLRKGMGLFHRYDEEGEVSGAPIGCILSLNKVSKYKGFDLSEFDWLIFDEFIPPIGEKVNRKEGDMLLELYMTVSRDRLLRGKKPLKLILLANASSISTPITNTLEITDTLAEMGAFGMAEYYDQEKAIYIHHLIEPEYQIVGENDPLRKALGHTAWGKMAFEGEFAYNDFSNVVKNNIKSMRPYCKLYYKTHTYYVYYREYDSTFYFTESAFNQKGIPTYDLNKEMGQNLFYREKWIDLRNACVEDRVKFSKYSMYDLLTNYKNFFKII